MKGRVKMQMWDGMRERSQYPTGSMLIYAASLKLRFTRLENDCNGRVWRTICRLQQ